MKEAHRIPFYTNPNCGQVAAINVDNNVSTFKLVKTHNAGDDTGISIRLLLDVNI